MKNIFALPAQLAIDIIYCVLRDTDHLPLLLVCKYFRGIAEDVIYRNITLSFLDVPDPCRRLHLLIRTLVERPDLAIGVRHLSIECGYDFLGLPDSEKQLERALIERMGLGLLWQLPLNLEEADIYAALLVTLTPKLMSLKVQLISSDGFYATVFCEGRLECLQKLTYGSGVSTDTPRESFGVIQGEYISQIMLSLPQLTELHLTGVVRGQVRVPEGNEKSAAKLKTISVNTAYFPVKQLEELLAVCPHLATVAVFVDNRGNSKYTVYGDLASTLHQVRLTIEHIRMGYYEVDTGIVLDSDPATSHDRERIQSIGSFAEFPQLKELTLPVVGYLGGIPQLAPALETVLPSGLRSLRIHDDTWILDRDGTQLYWTTVLCQLNMLVTRKANIFPNLKEIVVALQGSIGYFDFNGLFRGLQRNGKEIGIDVVLERKQCGWNDP